MVDAVLAQQPVEQRHELVEAVDALPERALLHEDAGVEVPPVPSPQRNRPPVRSSRVSTSRAKV